MSPFQADNTKDAPFYLSPDNSIQVPMMNQRRHFYHADLDFFEMLKIPYAGDALSMLVMLPKTHGDLARLENDFSAENFELWKKRFAGMRDVVLYMPRFRAECRFDLSGTLASMGMRDAFSLANADFSGMDESDMLYISSAIHKAFVDVNEEGTEAAATTIMMIDLCADFDSPPPPPPVIFRVDRPFLFLIQDDQTGAILFMGKIVHPEPSPPVIQQGGEKKKFHPQTPAFPAPQKPLSEPFFKTPKTTIFLLGAVVAFLAILGGGVVWWKKRRP